MNKILTLSTRPKQLNQLVGQDAIINHLHGIQNSKRIPHTFIIDGPIGCGKTTLARILATFFENGTLDDNGKSGSVVQEVNAADDNSVDFVRKLIEHSKYKPMTSKCKTVILDEAHQLTVAAQNALLKETEDTSEYIYYIFCTSNIKKIIPALQRRACRLTPVLLSNDDIKTLVYKTAKFAQTQVHVDVLNEFIQELCNNDVRSPGLIVQASERLFCGNSVQSAILNCESSNADVRSICQAVSKGDWKTCAALIQNINKSEVYSIKLCVLGYLKSILLKSIGAKSLMLSKAIQVISNGNGEYSDGGIPSLCAVLCLACDALKVKKVAI